MMELVKKDINSANLLKNCFRYIDDITTINCGGYFLNNFTKIYPPFLELLQVNTDPTKADALDIDIRIDFDKKFITKIFDKRDKFNFKSIYYPHFESNISHKIFFNLVRTEISRYYKICNTTHYFMVILLKFFKKLLIRGYEFKILKDSFRRNLFDIFKNQTTRNFNFDIDGFIEGLIQTYDYIA